jgi:hypothetical protein
MMPTPSSLEPHPELGLTKAATNKPKASALPFQGQAARQAATPAPASGPVASGHLSLEQYAQLCAERALWPDHADHIRRRYGLDTESEKAADRQYRTAFVGDAQLQTRFNQLFVDARRKLGG